MLHFQRLEGTPMEFGSIPMITTNDDSLKSIDVSITLWMIILFCIQELCLFGDGGALSCSQDSPRTEVKIGNSRNRNIKKMAELPKYTKRNRTFHHIPCSFTQFFSASRNSVFLAIEELLVELDSKLEAKFQYLKSCLDRLK